MSASHSNLVVQRYGYPTLLGWDKPKGFSQKIHRKRWATRQRMNGLKGNATASRSQKSKGSIY